MFSRVLVANRGEIAVRVIRAVHELGAEAVAVYSTADADALHVRLADRAVCIGPPPAAQSYLSLRSVVAAGTTTGCDAVHPGYGFLAESPDFVRACEENDLVFVGPGADVMARMGDKTRAKQELAAAGVELVPGTAGAASLAEVRSMASDLGYPVLLKAAAGRWRQGHAGRGGPGRARRGVRDRVARGRGRVRRRLALRRAGDRPGAARRGSGARGRGRRRADPRRARVLDPAEAPEADRGVAVAGSHPRDAGGDGGGGRASSARCRVPERRHVRVPARARRPLLLHRAQRQAAGRASGVRARDRHRHRARAAAHRRRRAAAR